MQQFLVLYRAPIAVMDEWMKLSPEERKADEEKMQADWKAWEEKHAGALKTTAGAGKAQRVTQSGVEQARNDIMLFSIVEAESAEVAAQMFVGHPQFQIPESAIEIMPAKYFAETT